MSLTIGADIISILQTVPELSGFEFLTYEPEAYPEKAVHIANGFTFSHNIAATESDLLIEEVQELSISIIGATPDATEVELLTLWPSIEAALFGAQGSSLWYSSSSVANVSSAGEIATAKLSSSYVSAISLTITRQKRVGL